MTDLLLPKLGPDSGTPEWYAIRNEIIGASEAAAACGLSRYKTRLALYLEKTGQTPPFEGNAHTRRGKRYEPLIAEDFEDMTGRKLLMYPCPMYFHPYLSGIAATPDGQVSETEGLEIKSSTPRMSHLLGEEGTDNLPFDWVCQAQHQMGVMGWLKIHFAVKMFEEISIYVVDRNQKLIDLIFKHEVDLLERICERRPPDPDFSHETTLELVKSINDTISDDRIMLTEDEAKLWLQYEELGREIGVKEKRRNAIKAEVIWGLGEAGGGILPDGRMIRRKWVNKDGYYVNPTSYIDTRAVKADGGRIVERTNVKKGDVSDDNGN